MKVKVSKEEYRITEEQSRIATMLLESKEFQFIRDYLNTAKEYAKESILTNSIHDVTEEVTISEKIRKLFFTSKQEQKDELVGQYKLVNKFFIDIRYYADLKAQLDSDIAKGNVLIEGGAKKDEVYSK
jgi:hypothetical protein